MATEIERRFILSESQYRSAVGTAGAVSKRLRQAYLAVDGPSAIRVRIADGGTGESAKLTIKSSAPGLVRQEFEYDIPVADAAEMLSGLRLGRVIDKTRTVVEVDGTEFEVDRFLGELDGLFLAEVELSDPDAAFARPDWLGAEITGDKRFSNAALALAETIPEL